MLGLHLKPLSFWFLHEDVKFSFVLHMAGRQFRIGAATPEKIRPSRPFDRSSRILIQNES
jgi:hypothetical protein